MENRGFTFSERQAEYMAQFISELVRQGVTYRVVEGCGCWTIELTGGY